MEDPDAYSSFSPNLSNKDSIKELPFIIFVVPTIMSSSGV